MGLIEFPIRRYQFTLVAFLCLIALGVFAFMNLAREEDPSFKISGFFVTAIYPGADPKDLERLVTKPIEDKLAELDDVHKMETTISDSVSFTVIEFKAFTDPDKKHDEVTREINALRPQLPADLALLEIKKLSPGLVNIVQFALVSDDAPYSELEDYARELKDTLKTVDGVRTSETWAIPRRELRVQIDQTRVAELGLTPSRIAQAIQSENANLPAGIVDIGPRSFSLKTTGSYTDLEQVRDTVITAEGGRIVRIRDVAEVSWTTSPWSYVGRFDGKRAVFVTANQKEGYNILEVQQAVKDAAARFERGLPKRIQLQTGFDQSKNVDHRLNRLYLDFAIAIGIVLLTLMPLGFRAAGIVMISVPLSLAFGITVLYFLGYSLNQISIAGFVISLGILVDDSIVVVENIARHMREGADRVTAAIQGTKQIFVAILGCTATVVFAFIPLMVLPGNSGKFLRVLPTTIIATVIGSLIVALFITPFLASRLLPRESSAEGNAFLQRVMGAIHRYYRPALHYCLARPRATVLAAVGGSLLLSVALVPVLGSSLFPKADTPQFLIQIEAPTGTSFDATDEALRFVEDKLGKTPGVKSWFTNVGHGNPQIYYNHIVRKDAANFGEIFVQLERYDTRATPQLLDALRQELDQYPAARIYVKEFVNGPPISAPVAVRVVGPDLAVIEALAKQVTTLVERTPGTRDVQNPLEISRTNLKLDVDTQKASLMGVPAVELDRAVRLSVAGIPVGTFKDESGEQYDIVVRTAVGNRADLRALDEVRVPSLSGASLPLSQLATVRFEKAPVVIQRYDRERAVTIDADVRPGFNTAKVTAEVEEQLRAMDWPRGYHYKLGGEAESSQEAFGGIGIASLVAIFGIFAILVLEFGSFRSTLIVLTVVPLGILGGLVMLLITGNSISFTASIGFVALIGIEIKNSILLVDFTNHLRREGVPIDEAIERAGEIRFLPILLTSATAIGGLLPLAVQNIGLYSPLAWVIIGGLISSTLLARLVTPVMYKLVPPPIDLDQPSQPSTAPIAVNSSV